LPTAKRAGKAKPRSKAELVQRTGQVLPWQKAHSRLRHVMFRLEATHTIPSALILLLARKEARNKKCLDNCIRGVTS